MTTKQTAGQTAKATAQHFFGVQMEVPAGWSNHSTLLFVGPPLPTVDVPSIVPQTPMASATVALSVESTIVEGTVVEGVSQGANNEVDLSSALASRLEQMRQALPSLKTVEHLEGAKNWCAALCEAKDQVTVRQLIGLVRQGTQRVTFVGTAPAASFDAVQPQLLAMLESLTVGQQPIAKEKMQ